MSHIHASRELGVNPSINTIASSRVANIRELNFPSWTQRASHGLVVARLARKKIDPVLGALLEDLFGVFGFSSALSGFLGLIGEFKVQIGLDLKESGSLDLRSQQLGRRTAQCAH